LILRAPFFNLKGKGNFSARRSRRVVAAWRRISVGYASWIYELDSAK